jgi:ABC-type multidrug transport system ATPase subunit
MPLIDIQLIEGVFTPTQKQQMIEKVTDAMVGIEGEAMRGVTWVRVQEIASGVAVRDLTFAVERGEVFGFLGPNGAGKTTTIRMLMGILVSTAGRARLNGLDCQRDSVEVKWHVGYLPDAPMFYDFLRGREILEFVGEMHGQSRNLAR